MEIKKQTTLQDIADAAGVSKATISRALKNDPLQALATRKRIQALAKQMGYHFDPIVSETMSQMRKNNVPKERGVIAYVIVSENENFLQTNPLYLVGAKKQAKFYGYKVERFWLDPSKYTTDRFFQILVARGIRGVLIAPFARPKQSLDIPKSRFAIAALGYSLETPEVHRATDNHSHGMSLALENLKARGYIRIGFSGDRAIEEKSQKAWLGAYLNYSEEVEVARRVPPCLIEKQNFDTVEAWIKKYRPKAIICSGSVSYHLMRQYQSGQKSIAFATLEANPETLPNISGIDQNNHDVGANGMDLVIQQLMSYRFEIPKKPKTVLTHSSWVEGKTTPVVGRARMEEKKARFPVE